MNKPFSNLFLVTILLLFGTSSVLAQKGVQIIDITKYGAKGDGKTLDTKAIQEAIDAAAKLGNGSKVVVPTNHQYLISTLVLKSNIEFHLEGNAQLLVSTKQEDYSVEGSLVANDVQNLKISGTGSINGRALEFMTHYDTIKEIWMPKTWRPKLFILTKCKSLEIKNITIEKAPSWSLHMLGCENVLIDGVKIKNNIDVPNCDGIDPDHCRNVEIRNCEISCGDDAIVIKATQEGIGYGPSANIWVHDCQLETQDSGVKIGTETTQDIYNIVFERCEIKTSCRGLTIQLRDEGNVYNVIFRDINFTSRYHSNPWWGRGEAISFTAIPRNLDTKIGKIHTVLVENVKGIAENSIRINGTKESRISDIRFQNVNVSFNRWTKYPGNVFDNKPTKAYEPIEKHDTPGISIRYSDRVLIENCSIAWGNTIPDYFTNAVQATESTGIELVNFKGDAANPAKYKAIDILKL
ncbi:glycoside hydrolase [Flavobacterium alvei]|uniref:Glycoside hydrolase n=1 Tax=Flavobacterium alvei TaxID=2080416 RepID=A0A2S5A3Y1_9FLAO|nr:glycosyl hydrolase family 28 protein [Flavobacterium alvei]POY37245.1 glycoside hydrolase [Flavobacterium alvei]